MCDKAAMGGALGSITLLTICVAVMLSLGMKSGMLEKPGPRRCGACGRLRQRGVCPCSARNL